MRQKREYRATYTVLRVDPAFLPLSKDAKLFWHTAKLELPVSGIGVCLVHTIAGLCSMSVDEAQRAEAELVEAGWVQRDGAILWIVNGLRHTPNLKPKDVKHRLHIQRLLKDLPSENTVVGAFRTYYPEWLDAPPDGASKGPAQAPSKGASKGVSQGPSERASKRHPKGHGSKKEERSKKKEDRSTTTTSASDDAALRKSVRVTWLTPFAEDWSERYGGDMPMGQAAKSFKPLVAEWGADEVRRRWAIYLAATDGAYASAARFAATFGEWNHPPKSERGSGSVAGASSPFIERARVLFALGQDYDLFAFSGDRSTYSANLKRAEADPRAGATFPAEYRATKLWEGIGGFQQARFAIEEIAKRLAAAPATAAAGAKVA